MSPVPTTPPGCGLRSPCSVPLKSRDINSHHDSVDSNVGWGPVCVTCLCSPMWASWEPRTWGDSSGGVLLPCPGCSAGSGRPSGGMGLCTARQPQQPASLRGHWRPRERLCWPPRVGRPTRGFLRTQALCLSWFLGGGPPAVSGGRLISLHQAVCLPTQGPSWSGPQLSAHSSSPPPRLLNECMIN